MNLGAPILDVSSTTASSTGTATSHQAAPVSIITGGTVSAPGYNPVIITKTVSNDPVLAAQAAAASSGTTTSTGGTTTTPVYVSTDRVGSSSHGVVQSGGSNFAPNVQVVMDKTAQQAQSKIQVAEKGSVTVDPV
jgi:hypothetical protein